MSEDYLLAIRLMIGDHKRIISEINGGGLRRYVVLSFLRRRNFLLFRKHTSGFEEISL